MNLLNLAPDIQEAILFLPRDECGKDPVTERELRAVCRSTDFCAAQLRMETARDSLIPCFPGTKMSLWDNTMAASEKPKISLPRKWTAHVRFAVLHVIGLAQTATAER